MPISVLFQDEHLLLVDKPAGLLVVPAKGSRAATVLDRLQAERRERLYPVHRLDEDTSGVLLIARTLEAKDALERMFRSHELERVYLALASRMPSPPAGRIESRLAEDERGVVRSVERGGERAVTHYRALERREGGVLVECTLETGRRNQIRAHLAELGCPIVGDRKYGYRARAGQRVGRVLLHAWRMEFRHPWTTAIVRVVAEPSESKLALPPKQH